MANYNESTVSGTKWTRANAVRIFNDYGQDGKICFDEEEVVALAEVGHALQDKLGYQPLHIRNQMVGIAQQIERVGAALMLALPLIIGIFRVPAAGGLAFLAGFASLGTPAIVHLITLPVEWDASFRRALPLLQEGNYLNAKDQRIARQILAACALTYVAASLAALLNLARWIALLRR